MAFRGLGSSASTNSNNCGSGPNSALSANPITFTENQQGNVVLEKLRQQRESGRFCDVILVVQDKQFPAHRNILAACSPYFDSILRMHKVVKEMVTVTCQSADVFELLLNYMYSGNVVIDRHNVTELLKLAHNFLVSKLKNYCAEYLDRYLDVQNCLCVKELAEKYNMPGLTKNASLFIESHVNSVLVESQDLLDYPSYRIELMISEKSFPNVTFEAQLRCIVRYVGHRLEERESHFSNLLASIRQDVHRRSETQTLLYFIEQESLFQQNPSLLLILLNFFRDNGLHGLCAKCEKLYHSITTSTTPVNDVSIYFNNGHGTRDNAVENDSAPDHELENSRILKHHSLLSSESTSIDGSPFANDSSSTLRVKQELPETPPPPLDHTLASSFQSSISSLGTAAVVSGSPDLPSLKIKLKLNDRSSTKTNEGNTRRKPAVSRHAASLSENGIEENAHFGDDCKQQMSKRGRSSKLRASFTSDDELGNLMNHEKRFSVSELIGPTAACSDKVGDGSQTLDDYCGNSSFEEHSSSGDDDWEESGKIEGKAEILYKCPHCVYTSANQSRIQSHIQKAHSKNRTFACTICPFECKWNREYYMHMKEHFSGPPFCCDSCDYSAERIQMLLTHRMKHTDERPFQCKQCDYKCRTKTNLVAHMRSHTGEKPFTCPSCYRSFAIKSTLDQHLATHSDARPFVCDQCSFSTKYQSHLISHKRIHTGDVFHCQYPDCTYSSPKKSQLAAHMRTHMAVRTHVCKQCGRSFIEKSHLVRHERIHLQVKPFKCDQCNYASSRRDKLKEHVQKHHIPGAPSSSRDDHRYPSGGGMKNPFCRPGKRGGGRNRRLSFGFGADGQKTKRISSVGGRFSASLIAGRPHSSMGFRPITPQGGSIVVGAQGAMAVPVASSIPSNPGTMMDFSVLLSSPTCATDSMVPLAAGHAYQPSPFEGGAALSDGDVLLSTQAGGLLSDSPHSTTNSLLSDPFPSAATPVSDPLQRPMSLPSLSAQAGVNPEFNLLNSFMAMF